MFFRDILVKGVLLCGCVVFRVSVGVRVKWVLPKGERDVVWCFAGVFFL